MEKSTFVRYNTPEQKKAAFMRSVNLRKEWETKMRILREETIEAVKQTRSGEYAGTLDMKDFDSFLKSIDDARKD